MNITDFEDKITERARSLGLSWRALARREESRFRADLAALRLLPPHQSPRASAFVPDMIRLVRRLEKLGRIVRDGDSWYYRTPAPHDPRNFPVGAELAKHAVPEPGQPAEALDMVPRDFLVWRRQEKPAASWASPWGNGAPGWHLECFTMAERHLRIPVDLHGGGNDLLFPHHYAENEIALAVYDEPFSRHFLHTAFVTEDGRKMSKSTGNLVPLRAALEKAGPDGLRWYLLSRPYNTRLEWDGRGLDAAVREFDFLKSRFLSAIPDGAGGGLDPREIDELTDRVKLRIADGFAVERGFGELSAYAERLGHDASGRFQRGSGPRVRKAFARLGELTGLSLE
jgi:cysteinyl-tRNA synthetase